MLQLSGSLVYQPIVSLRTNGRIATASSLIINPNNLKIEGLYCQDSLDKKQRLVLLRQDIREIIPEGILVNDHEVLTHPKDLVRLKNIMDFDFGLIGKPVFTVSKQRLGKVSDYAFETDAMYIQKLYVSQSLLKNFVGGSLSIDRSQIVEITSSKIVVNEPTVTEEAPAPATVPVGG